MKILTKRIESFNDLVREYGPHPVDGVANKAYTGDIGQYGTIGFYSHVWEASGGGPLLSGKLGFQVMALMFLDTPYVLHYLACIGCMLAAIGLMGWKMSHGQAGAVEVMPLLMKLFASILFVFNPGFVYGLARYASSVVEIAMVRVLESSNPAGRYLQANFAASDGASAQAINRLRMGISQALQQNSLYMSGEGRPYYIQTLNTIIDEYQATTHTKDWTHVADSAAGPELLNTSIRFFMDALDSVPASHASISAPSAVEGYCPGSPPPSTGLLHNYWVNTDTAWNAMVDWQTAYRQTLSVASAATASSPTPAASTSTTPTPTQAQMDALLDTVQHEAKMGMLRVFGTVTKAQLESTTPLTPHQTIIWDMSIAAWNTTHATPPISTPTTGAGAAMAPVFAPTLAAAPPVAPTGWTNYVAFIAGVTGNGATHASDDGILTSIVNWLTSIVAWCIGPLVEFFTHVICEGTLELGILTCWLAFPLWMLSFWEKAFTRGLQMIMMGVLLPGGVLAIFFIYDNLFSALWTFIAAAVGLGAGAGATGAFASLAGTAVGAAIGGGAAFGAAVASVAWPLTLCAAGLAGIAGLVASVMFLTAYAIGALWMTYKSPQIISAFLHGQSVVGQFVGAIAGGAAVAGGAALGITMATGSRMPGAKAGTPTNPSPADKTQNTNPASRDANGNPVPTPPAPSDPFSANLENTNTGGNQGPIQPSQSRGGANTSSRGQQNGTGHPPGTILDQNGIPMQSIPLKTATPPPPVHSTSEAPATPKGPPDKPRAGLGAYLKENVPTVHRGVAALGNTRLGQGASRLAKNSTVQSGLKAGGYALGHALGQAALHTTAAILSGGDENRHQQMTNMASVYGWNPAAQGGQNARHNADTPPELSRN